MNLLCKYVSVAVSFSLLLLSPSLSVSAKEADGIIEEGVRVASKWSNSSLNLYTQTVNITIPSGSFRFDTEGDFKIDKMDFYMYTPGYTASGVFNEGNETIEYSDEKYNDRYAFVTHRSGDLTIKMPSTNTELELEYGSGRFDSSSSGEMTYTFSGSYSFSQDIIVDESVLFSDSARVCYGNLYKTPFMSSSMKGNITSKQYIDVHDGSMYRIYNGWGVLNTDGLINNKIRYVVDIEFDVVVPVDNSNSDITFMIGIENHTGTISIEACEHYYDASGLLSDIADETTGNIQSGLDDFSSAQDSVITDNMGTLENYSFENTLNGFTSNAGIINAIYWISSILESLFGASVHGEVFFVISGLGLGCVLIGFSRLWKGDGQPKGQSKGKTGGRNSKKGG